MNSDRSWLRFVRLAVWSALLPGFGLATLMVSAWIFGFSSGLWYFAAIQTHAFALLTGWGGAMIFGVALHFLPRLRGVKLVHPEWVSVFFWFLALGLTARIVGQPLLALLAPARASTTTAWLNGVIAGGLALQAIGMMGLLAILIVTFRSGRPLKKNKGFQQIAPLLTVAALALILAQLAWCWGVVATLVQGRSLVLLPVRSQSVAVDLMLFGFVASIGIAMSSRIFPLTFRTQLPHSRGLRVAAWLLGGGVVLTTVGGMFPGFALAGVPMESWAGLLSAAGLLGGAFAVRIFQARKPIKDTQVPYRAWEDPAGVGVLTAYFWIVVAAGFLLLTPWPQAGVEFPAFLWQKNLSRHAIGLGFMTMLIVSVGWKMLPGFTGGQPRGRGLLWAAVLLGNLAVLLRILPVLFPGFGVSERTWSEVLFPFAGLSAFTAILVFAIALRLSFRPPQTS